MPFWPSAGWRRPIGSRHLALGQIGVGHLDEGPPRVLDKAVLALTASRQSNNLRAIGSEPAVNITADEALVQVGAEALGEVPSVRAEFLEGGNDVDAGDGLEAVDPAIAHRTVDQDEDVIEAPQGDAVAIADVQVDSAEEFCRRFERAAATTLWNGGEVSKGGRWSPPPPMARVAPFAALVRSA